MMVINKNTLSLDEWVEISADQEVEIVYWELIQMAAAGMAHQMISRNIFRILDRYVLSEESGEILYDGMTYLMNSPTTNLKHSFVPDVSFVSNDNIPADFDPQKPHPGVPNLAVEVISPGDNAARVQEKVEAYLQEGTDQIWLVYPTTKEVLQYINGEEVRIVRYKGVDTLDVEALFPGLDDLTLDAIFKLPPWAL